MLTPLEEIRLDLQDRPVGPDSRLNFDPDEKWVNLAKDQICNQGLVLAGLSASLIMDSVGVMDSALDNLRCENLLSMTINMGYHCHSFNFRQQLLDSILILSRKCWFVLYGMMAVQLDVLSHLSVSDGESQSQIARGAKTAMDRLLQRLPAEAKANIASRAQETAFELSEDLSKLNPDASLGSAMGRLQAAITLISGLEDSTIFFLSETYLQQVVKALLKISCLEKDPGIANGYGLRTDSDANLADILFEATHCDIR